MSLVIVPSIVYCCWQAFNSSKHKFSGNRLEPLSFNIVKFFQLKHNKKIDKRNNNVLFFYFSEWHVDESSCLIVSLILGCKYSTSLYWSELKFYKWLCINCTLKKSHAFYWRNKNKNVSLHKNFQIVICSCFLESVLLFLAVV